MQTVAIIIGVSHYLDPVFSPLPGARADAERFASSLLSWGLPKESIYFLSDEEATKDNIVKAFYSCRPIFDSDARMIFYFAGHGVRERLLGNDIAESFLVCHDTTEDLLATTGFRLVELMQLQHIVKPTQTFLFIDACSLRLNHIQNPLNEQNILSTSCSKGLFCLLSSGAEKSYENPKIPSGYFTNALLKTLGELRQEREPNCYDLSVKVAATLKSQSLPAPEVYHIGIENMWPLEGLSKKMYRTPLKESPDLILRWEAIGQIQDLLVSSPDVVIWMWGEGGMGKTVIAEQFRKMSPQAIYISAMSEIEMSLSMIEQIRSQKGELFFNRPPESNLHSAISHIAKRQPGTVLIFDHLERLSPPDLEHLLGALDQLMLPAILISRYPCPLPLFKRRANKIFEWMTIPLTLEEIEQMVLQNQEDPAISEFLLNASQGNVLKVRQILANILGQNPLSQDKTATDYIKSMQALAATGGFLDEHLFCRTFGLKFESLATLEKLGLIRYTPNGCFPHDMLNEMVEENRWPLDIHKACVYWKRQIERTPYNRSACSSMVLLASQIEDCSQFKKSLCQCLETLNARENINFIIELIAIFQKHKWEDVLLLASDYLIDHEEYLLAKDVLSTLLLSERPAIRNHALKNEARRLVWTGQFGESIDSNVGILKTCRNPKILIPLKNNIGIAHFFSGNLDTALGFFKDVIHFKGKKDEREVGVAKLMIGLIMTYRGENASKAKEFLERSLHIFETTKYYLWNIVSLNSLGDLCYRLEQWRQALYHLDKAIHIAETLQNKTFLLFTFKNVVRVNLRLFGAGSQEVSMSVENLEYTLTEVLKTGHNWVTVWAYNALATVYAHRKEVEKLQHALEVVAPLTENYTECHIFTLSNLGHLFALKNDFTEAKKRYQEAIRSAELLKNSFAIKEIRNDFLGIGLPHSLQAF